MKNIAFWVLLSTLIASNAGAQGVTSTFEMRYITSDAKADGETDFCGETEWMSLDQRIDFLSKYASFASGFYGNPGLDVPLIDDGDLQKAVDRIKPQPLTNVRQTLRLSDWRAYGYRAGKEEERKRNFADWSATNGATVEKGCLTLSDCTVEKNLEPIRWRFRLHLDIKNLEAGCTVSFNNEEKSLISVRLANQVLSLLSGVNKESGRYEAGTSLNLEIYGDFPNNRFFVTANGKSVVCPMGETDIREIDKIVIRSEGKTEIDDISLFNFVEDRTNKHTPYFSSLLVNENFNDVLPMQGWQSLDYDDSAWEQVTLPSSHGGLREKEESYYLRKKIRLADFERAVLKLETIDPGGEVWINGQPVAVINNRHPYDLDVTEYLQRNQENIIAVRVKPYKADHRMLHSPSDPYIGWFLGRATLILTNRCMIKDVFAHTGSLDGTARQVNRVLLQYSGVYVFEGSVEVNYYPWFPVEGEKVATVKRNVEVRPSVDNEIVLEMPVENPALWTPESPNLYRVEVILRDKEGREIDDYMLTTGIRTISQKDGDLYVNNRPEILKGAQILGSRYPVETMSKNYKCVSDETIAKDLMMIKEMNGNLLRLHIHAEKDTTDGINDPRYAEYADQLGVYLLWQTAAWIREGEAWNVDFEGYPKFMRQVYNHPSIVMWEASNHPNRFKLHDISDSHDFVTRGYRTLSAVDTSRLISPTSFWQHMHYGNYDGSLDKEGNPIVPNPVLMEKLMTRGSQDAYTGYGAKWTALRKAPNKWAASCLAANDKAYFNFEHEESAAQPNWTLAEKEPWFEVQSYEWEYEKGSIGRLLDASEWRISQAFQAFAAWESMKKQILIGYDGFSWCSLESGSNMFTYQKPLTDPFGVPKLAYYANQSVFQPIWAGSGNVDVVYGPADRISPVLFNLGQPRTVDLAIELKNDKGKRIDRKVFKNIQIAGGRTIVNLDSFRFKTVPDGCYFLVYTIKELNPPSSRK
ncbi:glycosyl hydrolase family 2 [Parabacteroides hominis]|uniref:Glycosyl hydrolase family 2 n=1 Tax=Parabacteroides hominis TaxID=2763057 RepID=A0ABR7DNG6_9BACT|nr:glycosyl hydrolase family 2 [Parabacteroides hominis]MBC5632984.1 glycosyl hydrolase family 2 [Parabacteroides hominis]